MHARPPSAARPPTSGIPAGMRPPSRTRNGNDMVAPKGISVVNRPMSKQGLPSAHTQSGERQVADKSFFIGILRNKINETVAEMTRLEKEIDTRKRGQSIQVNLQQQVESLRKEITESEAVLADYNVLSDRLSNGVSADDMNARFEDMRQMNLQREDEVNRLFKEKKDLQKKVEEQEKKVQEMMHGTGAPELSQMAKEIESLEKQCEQLRAATGDLKGKTREELLQMVKDATQKIGDADRTLQEEQQALNYVQTRLTQMSEREGDLQTDRGRQYVKLLQRDKDMTTYIQNYPQGLQDTKQELAACQKRVFELLVQTSRDLESIQEMPTIDNFKRMQNDLFYKERQMQDAQSTTQALLGEVEKRRRELDDLQNVDKKINDEIDSLKQKMIEMEDEMPKFSEVDSVREEGEIRKRMKTEERDRLKKQLSNLRKATNVLATKCNEMRAQVRSNEIQAKLHVLEKDIRTKAAENNNTVEYIEENRRRTNYSLVKRAAMNIVQEINNQLLA